MRRCGQCDHSVLQRGFVDTFFGLSTGGTVCRQKVAGITSFVDKSVGQTVGYGNGIARVFVRQLLKMSSKCYRSSITGKYGPGGI